KALKKAKKSKKKLPGYGKKGINGGEPGDMYVVVSIKPHKYYVREGLNLHIDNFPVSFLMYLAPLHISQTVKMISPRPSHLEQAPTISTTPKGVFLL
ncbi:DnaJ C-terminal domain-containing protein, partial [Mycoplasmopsis bovis]|uniref:DnaJ C-terminal domain-containing protein n=1 Tax=Mycoplasmopsis bovis TaxID=28903 RepID=UPI003D2B5CC8